MNTVTNLVTITSEPWPQPKQFAIAFLVGSAALFALYWIVWFIMRCLKSRFGTSAQPPEVQRIAFSPTFAAFEQFLLYLAAVAGREIFGFALAGWLVLKVASRYALWQVPECGGRGGVAASTFEAAVAHNRYLIFLLGTGMSLAASGIAGFLYHYTLHLLNG